MKENERAVGCWFEIEKSNRNAHQECSGEEREKVFPERSSFERCVCNVWTKL